MSDIKENDTVHHPKHYNEHPTGIECINIIEQFSFNIGNAIKYLWRADYKGDVEEDFQKAIWYIEREMLRRKVLGTL